MAQYTVATNTGVGLFATIPDKRKAGTAGGQVPNSPLSATTFNATKDVAAMRTQLATLNAGYYTSAMLDSMTANDMVYALRVGYDSAGIV